MLLNVCLLQIYILRTYVIVIPQYEYNILVITQAQGKSKDAGDS